jgi:hypothetical protein
VFTIDGIEAWTVEDGGRIRHRDASGNWTFQAVPPEVKDTLHRIFFLPGSAGAQTGWAVGSDGSVLKTVNSGSVWQRVAQLGQPPVSLCAARFTSPDSSAMVAMSETFRRRWERERVQREETELMELARLLITLLQDHPSCRFSGSCPAYASREAT